MNFRMFWSYCLPLVAAVALATEDCATDSAQSLLQHSMQRSAKVLNEMRSDDVVNMTPPGSVPRHELWNYVVPVRSSFLYNESTYPEKHADDANKCNSNTPDGRIYFCGVIHRFIRYFKFESMTFTDIGLPIFDDGVWSQWTEELGVWNPPRATLCFPDFKRPFEVLQNGNHFYSMYTVSDKYRRWLNVTVAHPMTPQAEIVEVVQGKHERLTPEQGRYGAFTGDGLLLIAKDPTSPVVWYSALPEDGEPCSLTWPEPRLLHEMPHDPDGLNLPARYPMARVPFRNNLGVPYSEEYPVEGTYLWIDLDGRNMWFTGTRGFRVMGEDTSGIEYLMDSPLNPTDEHSDEDPYRCMASPLWNFESERTIAHRFPGELHTSGVGSGSAYQLPMSKAHHVLPTFSALGHTYSEPELFNVWKSPHWDIVFLPMTASWTEGYSEEFPPYTPDLSRHFLNGRLVGDARVDWNGTMDLPTRVQGVGHSMLFGTSGAVVVNFTTAADVPGVTSAVRAFTAQISFKTFWPGSNSFRWLLDHPNLSLRFGRGRVEWFMNEQLVQGGTYTNQEWQHLALVFDGKDHTVTTYNNGFEVTTDAMSASTFQLSAVPLAVGNRLINGGASSEGLNGQIDNFRLMAHARSQRNLCKSAFGSDCGDAISYHPTSTQYEISMQLKECTAEAMHTVACAAALHRVCSNLDATHGKDAGISNELLGALTPPGPPVSMGGVVVSIGAETADVACIPSAQHLSVPVDWWIMKRHGSRCTAMTDHYSESIHCNIAAHSFCVEAFTEVPASIVTGILFEADARAWVTCFAATAVMQEELSALPSCDEDLAGISCQLEVSALCTGSGHDAGLVQSTSGSTVDVHCFDAPPHLGVHTFLW